MIDQQNVERAAERFRLSEGAFERLELRRDRKRRTQRIRAGVLGLAIAIVAGWLAIDAVRSTSIPANPPDEPQNVEHPFARANGEVLRFTGVTDPFLESVPGDLVAVDIRTGEERVLVEDLTSLYSARWSADGRWLAYETRGSDGGRELWVAGGSKAPRVVATGDGPSSNLGFGAELDWKWSPTGAVLATIEHSETLRTIDVATGETTELEGVGADLLEPGGGFPRPWAWSSDGTRLVFASPIGTPNGSLYSVDVRSGEPSLLARLPGFIERVRWSPDGAHIAVQAREESGQLYVLDADGSDIRLVADDSNSLGFAWSPDGTRLAFGSEVGNEVRIRVATTDGAAPAEIGTVGRNRCYRTSWGGNFECSVTWSPDGNQVAFRKGETGWVTVFDAGGAGEAEPLDELTYLGWDGGWYASPIW